MNQQSAEAIVTIAALAALADGASEQSERDQISAAASRLGVALDDIVLAEGVSPPMAAAQVARRLMTAESREAAYQVALAVCHADGYANTQETMFLRSLAQSLDVVPNKFDAASVSAVGAVETWLAGGAGAAASGANGALSPAFAFAAGGESSTNARGGDAASLDEFILDQAMLTAALELLPDRLANIGIIPLQMRLVHTVGQRSGAPGDTPHVKELMATLGIGVVAQVMESVVRKAIGGVAGGLLGGLFGGAAGVAAGGAVTFATTYALGHAAQQYYAQGRTMDRAQFKALFEQLKTDGTQMYPRVQSRIAELARGNTLASIMQSVRGMA